MFKRVLPWVLLYTIQAWYDGIGGGNGYYQLHITSYLSLRVFYGKDTEFW